MPRLLQSKLRCFYCGSKSSQQFAPGLRQWHCAQCEAENYLDKDGQITEPPALQTTSRTQYAQPIARSTSPELLGEDSIFCSTCIKNQHALNETLASYLPDPEDPTYSDYENELPSYRRRMEEIFPQVCHHCEPKVRERMRQAGYLAKSDHLRRMMDHTKARRVAYRWGWRRMVVAAGALAYWASILGQLAWHVASAMPKDRDLDSSLPTSTLLSKLHCGIHAVQHRRVANGCSRSLEPVAEVALVLGLLSIWWNPGWSHKLEGKQGRLVGLGEYYKSQTVLLGLRFIAYLLLQDLLSQYLKQANIQAIHLVVVVAMVVTTVSSQWLVKIETNSVVTWRDIDEPLLPPRTVPYYDPAQPYPAPQQGARNELSAARQAFPVSLLAPAPIPEPAINRLPTPPPQEGDSEAMDWEATRTPLRVQRPRFVPPTNAPVSSPFRGHLPALPTNRGLQPQARKVAAAPTNFFSASGNRDAFNSRTKRPETQQVVEGPIMAEPKFFPQSDFETYTGLETLFTKVFSMEEDPLEVRQAQNLASQPTAPSSSTSPRPFRVSNMHAVSAGLLSLSFFAWLLLEQVLSIRGKVGVVAVVGIVAFASLLEAWKRPRDGDFLISKYHFSAEVVIAIGIGMHIWQQTSDHHGKCGLLVKGLTAAMSGQELSLALSNENKTLIAEKTGSEALGETREPQPLYSTSLVLRDDRGQKATSADQGHDTQMPPAWDTFSTASTTTPARSVASTTSSSLDTPRFRPNGSSDSQNFTLGGLDLSGSPQDRRTTRNFQRARF